MKTRFVSLGAIALMLCAGAATLPSNPASNPGGRLAWSPGSEWPPQKPLDGRAPEDGTGHGNGPWGC